MFTAYAAMPLGTRNLVWGSILGVLLEQKFRGLRKDIAAAAEQAGPEVMQVACTATAALR